MSSSVLPLRPCKAPALPRRGTAEDPELDRRRQRHVKTLPTNRAPRAQGPAGGRAVAAKEKLVASAGPGSAGRVGNCRRMRVA